ncbi:DUF456 family protein [Exiguobacterium sp. s48]|uniref:DUF456 domain-containing protein n=1 Tax=Exiguobacterium sp. s48 TaxID=2751273 RepID=UPI001BEA2C55|nr:DUF456 family protein [Exiguobacterium sp. s48]
MTTLLWILIIASFIVAFAGLIYPVIPSVLFLFIGYMIYGFGFSFEPLTWTFWVWQIVFLIFLFVVDYVVTRATVDKRGGSERAKWGATIGLIAGPFIFPLVGVLIFPFIFAFLAELTLGKTTREAWSIGVGTVLAFLGSTLLKVVGMTMMVILFFIYI